MSGTFERVGTAGGQSKAAALFKFVDPEVASPRTFLYFVPLEPLPRRVSLSVEETWRGPERGDLADKPGWYVFVGEEIDTATKFAREVRKRLPSVSRLENGYSRRAIAWIPDANGWVKDDALPAPPTVTLVQHSFLEPSSRSIESPSPRFAWADNLGLKVPAGSRVELETDGVPRFAIAAGRIDLSQELGTLSGIFPAESGARLAIPLTSDQAGSFSFRARCDPTTLREHYGCDFRYVLRDESSRRSVSYPLFPPASAVPDPNRTWGFDVWLHPLHPEDADCTRFALDLGRSDDAAKRSRKLRSGYFFTTGGKALELEPKRPAEAWVGEDPKPTFESDSPGFALVKSPVPGVSTAATRGKRRYAWQYGLAPVGRFVVQGVSEKAGEARNSGDGAYHLMCGLAGTEYLLVRTGTEIEFLPGRSAEVEAGGEPDAESAFTTSWARVHGKSGTTPAAGEIIPSYCAQPSTASYFARPKRFGADDLSIPVGISLATLGSRPSENPVFPLVPYGGVFGDPPTGVVNPNPGLDARALASFESRNLEPLRRTRLRKEAFENSETGPIFFDPVKNTAFDGGWARTPMGFVAELNKPNGDGGAPAGSVNRLKLARSPLKLLVKTGVDPAKFLELTAAASGVVNPDFTYAALRDELFMVVSDPTLLWPSDGSGAKIKLGDFTFHADVGAYRGEASDKIAPKALVVFKFVPGVSLQAAVEDPTIWTRFFGEVKGGGKESAEDVRTRLKGYLDKADKDKKGLYTAFKSIVDDPNWSGLLILNCPLDYEALPPDIQILLGGIDGALRAHHFGVTINRVKNAAPNGTDTAKMSLEDSSLFAVIDYDKEFEAPRPADEHPEDYPKFQVLKFNVEYANSKLRVFKSKIAFSLAELFGNPVTLSKWAIGVDHPKTRTFVIEGVYTLREDGTGSLVFSTEVRRVFKFDAPGDKVRVVGAMRVDDATLVPVERRKTPNETIKLTAIAAFRLDGVLAFKDEIGGDLFSYGVLDDGKVPSDGLVFVDYGFAMTTEIPGEWVAELQVRKPARLLPITHDLSAMKVDQGLSVARDKSFENWFPSKLDSVRHVADGQGTKQLGAWQVVGDGLEAVEPVFMLHFKVPLGSLGGLVSSSSNLVADLHIGWVPGGRAAKDDKIGAVLVLPAQVAGADGFSIQGLTPSKFGSVHLDRVEGATSTGVGRVPYPYCLRFEDYVNTLLGIPLSFIGERKDLGIFGAPTDPGGDHSVWFVGKTTADEKELDVRMTIELPLPELPEIFIGRSFAIETDPTSPKVIDDAISSLNMFRSFTVHDYVKGLYANTDAFSSAAGMTFALKFSFLVVSFSMLFHDDDFYGAKIKFEPPEPPEEEEEPKKPKLERQKNSRNLLEGVKEPPPDPPKKPKLERQKESFKDVHKAPNRPAQKKKKKGLDKLGGFEFSITYRKISESLGVWSATIFIDVGPIMLGAAELTLPDFGISIWTNGNWRLDVGWPIEDNPITLQFQAGPIPVIAKLGFYLAKLSSEAVPAKFTVVDVRDTKTDKLICPPNFELIWAFGLAISAGIGKEWDRGPFSASASLSLQLTAEGFLASFEGNMTEDGVDYHWICLSLALVGQVEGEVDFKIISASLSITLTLKLALAVESHHSAKLALTFEAVVRASVKIVFVRIHFSFSKTLTIWETTLGSGPEAMMDGPTFPAEVVAKLPKARLPKGGGAAAAWETLSAPAGPEANSPSEAAASAQAPEGRTARVIRRTIKMSFLLQSTAVSNGKGGGAWKPQAVASLVVRTSKLKGERGGSPFRQLALGIAEFLDETWGGGAPEVSKRLAEIEAALGDGKFDDRVEECLSGRFVFEVAPAVAPGNPAEPPPVAVLPMHPSLALEYDGENFELGKPLVERGYDARVRAYFGGDGAAAKPKGDTVSSSNDSVASILFDEYFVMLAKQLVADLQREVETREEEKKTKVPSLASALTQEVLDNVGGFVSRFLMSGVRLPVPATESPEIKKSAAANDGLAALYRLTHQQFALNEDALKSGNSKKLREARTARLVANGGTPAWIGVGGGVRSKPLDRKLLFGGVKLTKPPWKVEAIPEVTAVPTRFPINATFALTQDRKRTVYKFSDGLRLAALDWRNTHKREPGPWLRLETVQGGKNPDAQKAASYAASTVLAIPLTIKTIPNSAGTGAGSQAGSKAGPSVLANTYSLDGTDEVHRAFLQALLNDEDAEVTDLDFAVKADKGDFVSIESPKVLVRSNLSTATGGADVSDGIADSSVSSQDDAASDARLAASLGPNYAKPSESNDHRRNFLRLIWECSIVQSGGFYLQIEKLQKDHPDLFEGGKATVLLLVRTGGSAGARGTVALETYHNALLGDPLENSAVLGTLQNSESAEDPVLTHKASYPAGCAGWRIDWKGNPPTEHDVAAGSDPAARLRGLYQMVSYKVTSIDGKAPKTTTWSRPITAVYLDPPEGAAASDKGLWRYQKAFATAPLLPGKSPANTYAAVGKPLEVQISVEDIFGNSYLAGTEELPVVYNDDILDLAQWAGTQTDYTVDPAPSGKVELAVNFSYGSLLFTLEDIPDPTLVLADLLEETGPSHWIWDELWKHSGDEVRSVLVPTPPEKADEQSKEEFDKQVEAFVAQFKTPEYAEKLRVALVEGFNKVIRSGDLYSRARFKEASLPEQAKELLEKTLDGNLLVFRNRLLLEACLPETVSEELLYASEDFEDPATVVAELRKEEGPSSWIWPELLNHSSDEAGNTLDPKLKAKATADETRLFNEHLESPEYAQELEDALLEGLNNLARGRSVHGEERFEKVAIPERVKALVEKNPGGNLGVVLNQMLLEACLLARCRRSERLEKEREQRARRFRGELDRYAAIREQLRDSNLSAEVDTAGLLHEGTLKNPLRDSGSPSSKPARLHLSEFATGVIEYLEWRIDDALYPIPELRPADAKPKQSPTKRRPQPTSLRYEVKKSYPHRSSEPWDGDLRELRVSLVLARKLVTPDVAKKAPHVARVSSPITPVQGKSTSEDPTGLEAFAFRFERAYHGFDGSDGVIKVATGVNSDLTSPRFGMPSLWLARWGNAGITVKILNDDKHKPVYYAPPPLSTRLITREVAVQTGYEKRGESEELQPTYASKVFSAVDMDRLAAGFLSSVENIFSPRIAPEVAGLSKRVVDDKTTSELYDPYVVSKAKLAARIADKLTQIYESQITDFEDKARLSAVSTMRQALLQTLENDYGVSTLIQMEALITLNGRIEPHGQSKNPPNSPPNLYGTIGRAGAGIPEAPGGKDKDAKPVPYSFSPAKLPLEDGRAWLNFLLSVQNPGAQRALNVDLAYQMGFVEHNIDREQEKYGYVPSNWLTFVRQQDNAPEQDPMSVRVLLRKKEGASKWIWAELLKHSSDEARAILESEPPEAASEEQVSAYVEAVRGALVEGFNELIRGESVYKEARFEGVEISAQARDLLKKKNELTERQVITLNRLLLGACLERKNTLTAPMGVLDIPVPLRSYPPLPKLMSAEATQDTPPEEIEEIEQALLWTYSVKVGLPVAKQDTLNLMVTLNEPPVEKSETDSEGGGGPDELKRLDSRPPVKDLFEGLARYDFEYRELAPKIDALAGAEDAKAKEDARPALEHFSRLVEDVASKWHEWTPPTTKVEDSETPGGAMEEVWHFRIDHARKEDPAGTLIVEMETGGAHSWPRIEGYGEPETVAGPRRIRRYRPEPEPEHSAEPESEVSPEENDTAEATSGDVKPKDASPPSEATLSWSPLFVLDYQSARASAYTERNRNLGGAEEATNEVFVYHTETVKTPSSAVPLIKVPKRLSLKAGTGLAAAITSMLEAMHDRPAGAVTSSDAASSLLRKESILRLEGLIAYSFRLLDDFRAPDGARSRQPLFLMHEDIEVDKEAATAERIAGNLRRWHAETLPSSNRARVNFRLTLFATRIVKGGERLPLVQFDDFSIDVGDSDWWEVGS